MLKSLLTTVAVCGLVVASPAFAGGHRDGNTNVNANSAKSSSSATARSTASQRQGQVQGQTQDDSTKVEGSWGFSYVDVPTSVPQGVVTNQIAILSDSWKVGPLFGHASQEALYLPGGVADAYLNVLIARGVAFPKEGGGLVMATRQENFAYESQFAMQTVLCSKDPKTAKQLLLTCVEE